MTVFEISYHSSHNGHRRNGKHWTKPMWKNTRNALVLAESFLCQPEINWVVVTTITLIMESQY